MKTKSTYWSVIRSLVATIVAVMGFAIVSVGQELTLPETDMNNILSVEVDNPSCGGGVSYKMKVKGYNECSFSVKNNGSYVSFNEVNGFKETKSVQYSWYPENLFRQAIVFPSTTEDKFFYVKIDVSSLKIECFPSSPNCGPSVPNIADGASSVCLNNDTERGSISAPTVDVDSHGWMLDGEKVDITNIGEYLLANMSNLDGKTLKYWAEDADGNPGYSNAVTLSVCLPEVGRIGVAGKDYVCLVKGESTYYGLTAPSEISYPAGFDASDFTMGWEIIETGRSYTKIDGSAGEQWLEDAEGNKTYLSELYGKKIRFFVEGKYHERSYSNSVKLMRNPTGSITNRNNFYTCPGERIKVFPEVTYNLNGTTLSNARWDINNGNSYIPYNGQTVTAGAYGYLYYRVTSLECGENAKTPSRTTIKFYDPVVLQYQSELPSEVFCASPVHATVVDNSGNDVTEGTNAMYWTKDGEFVKRTVGNQYDFTFDCDIDGGSKSLGAYYIDQNGCKSTVSQTVLVSNTFFVYRYTGPTGSSSDVTNPSNWCRWENGSCSGTLSNFTGDDCKYIIDKENVLLKSDQSWSISGLGSRLVVGDAVNTSSFVVEGNFSCENGISVEKDGTLDIRTSSVPLLGRLNQVNSTVKYSSSTAQVVRNASYDNLVIEGDARTVTIPDGNIFIYGDFDPSSSVSYSVEDGNTMVFCSNTVQDVPGFNYSNLEVGNGYVKTLTGNVKIKNSLVIGTITTLNASNKTIELDGPGNVVVQAAGKFVPGTSTVKYMSESSSNVAALNYYNLDLGSGTRVYSKTGIIGIAGDFKPSTGDDIVEGSTVEFNGQSAKQNIPAADFYNLTFSNPKGIYIMNDATGDVNVYGVLFLKEGVVDASNNNRKLVVRNTDPDAVSVGSNTAFIGGDAGRLYRYIKPNLTNSSESYLFPVGRGTTNLYRPLVISNITTGSSPVLVNYGNRASNGYEYWLGGVVNASVSVTVGDLGGKNAIEASDNSDFTTTELLYGTVSGNSILNSDVSRYSYYRLTTRPVSPVTYKYKCSGDVSQLSNWTKTSGTGSNVPASFDIDDATWIIDCPASTSNTISITGANSKLEITPNGSLDVKSNGSLAVGGTLVMNGELTIEEDGDVSVYGGYTHNTNNKAIFTNYGTMSFYTDVTFNKVDFDNYGDFYLTNADFNLFGSASNLPRDTRFSNHAQMFLTNSSMTISGRVNGNIATSPTFENITGSVLSVDNTMCTNKNVFWGDICSLSEGEIDLQVSSTIRLKGCDLEISHVDENTAKQMISAMIIIEDGNFKTHMWPGQGGGHLCVNPMGGVYLRDTDNSGDDGLLLVNGQGGNYQFDVEGTVYAEGLVYESNGGGSALTVKNGATAFIGDMGASIVGNNNTSIKVKGGGTLNYCGNITPGADNVGNVENGGILNYAESYYLTESPVHQHDFTGEEGSTNPMYSSIEECSAAFKGEISNILPVELTMLYGICKNGNVELHWQTASESNNEGFVILRSFDGVNFVEIAEVVGAGTSTGTINYMYVDEDDKTGMVYYKLRQVDFDGKTKESKIVAVQTCGPNAQFAIAEDEITVSFKNPEETNYVVVTSLSGKIVFSKSFKDVAEARIASPRIKGVYIISVIDSKQITSEKFIK